jgi:hypothetical protein
MVRLLLAMVPDQRAYGSFLKEDSPAYPAEQNGPTLADSLQSEAFLRLLQDIPIP